MTTRQCDQCDRPSYAKGLCKLHHADDLLDMVLPDGWRDVIEEGRAA